MRQTTLQRHISRLMALLLCVLTLLPCVPVARAEEGTCGDHLSWSIDSGTLMITGSGTMANYTVDKPAPWYSRRQEILCVQFSDKMTNIGNLAFYQCDNLQTVVIPDSVKSVGQYAFADCTGLKLLKIGSSLETIGEGAFQNCTRLNDFRFPDSLKSIGTKAFYRCEALTCITVPIGVTNMGSTVFGYCKSLVSADIQAMITEVPEFLFYGCDNLTSVTLPSTVQRLPGLVFEGCVQLQTIYYYGNDISKDTIKENIGDSNTSFGESGTVSNKIPPKEITTNSSTDTGGNTSAKESITVIQGENSSVSVKTENTQQNDTSDRVDITITVENGDGWTEAKDHMDSVLEDIEQDSVSRNDASEKIDVEVLVKADDEISADFLDSLAGKNVSATIQTESGIIWKIDGTQLDKDSLSGKYDLRYSLTEGSEKLTQELNAVSSYSLRFESSMNINAEVFIQLGVKQAYQRATLFQHTKEGIQIIQTVVVDDNGYAHFYLGSVDKEMEYSIGMNIPIEAQDAQPLIPEEIQQNYSDVVNYAPIQYEITGRKSSWNMGLGKVMAILAVVMVSAVVVIGFVMYFWNKQRLQNGYVPKWEDDEE